MILKLLYLVKLIGRHLYTTTCIVIYKITTHRNKDSTFIYFFSTKCSEPTVIQLKVFVLSKLFDIIYIITSSLIISFSCFYCKVRLPSLESSFCSSTIHYSKSSILRSKITIYIVFSCNTITLIYFINLSLLSRS